MTRVLANPLVRRSRVARATTIGVLVAGTLIGLPAGAQATTTFPAFAFPFASGQQIGSAGLHSDDVDSGVKNAIDFNPDDRTVRAPLAGTARLQHCSAGDWVTIDHEGGWRTGFYHMENIKVSDGEQVKAGTELGTIGNALPCGGSSSGAHVHFTLWSMSAGARFASNSIAAGNWDNVSYSRLSSEVANFLGQPLDGKVFGGWRLNEGPGQYSGTVTRIRDDYVVKLPGYFRYDPTA